MFDFNYTCGDALEPTIGKPITIHIVRDEYTANATFSLFVHSLSGRGAVILDSIFDRFDGDDYTWTPPEYLAYDEIYSSHLSINLKLVINQGTDDYPSDVTYLPECSKFIDLLIPDTLAPSIEATFVDGSGYSEVYGGGVQGKAFFDVQFYAEPKYTAKLYGMTATFDDQVCVQTNSKSAAFKTDVVKTCGDKELVITATDSRGNTAKKVIKIPVLQYEPPKIESLVLKRCNSDGESNPKGDYIAAVFSVSVSELNSKNTATYTIQYKKKSDPDYTTVSLEALSGLYSITDETYIFKAELSSSYDVALIVEDDFSSVSKKQVGMSERKLWSALKNGLGFAFGKVAERVGFLDMGFGIYMNSNKIVDLGEPSESSDATTKKYVDSAITSANEHSNVLLASHSFISDALWENDDPNSGFPAQRVSLSLAFETEYSNSPLLYSALLIKIVDGFISYAGPTGGVSRSAYSHFIVPLSWSNDGVLSSTFTYLTSYKKTASRLCEISGTPDGDFGNCTIEFYDTTYDDDSLLDVRYSVVPAVIYGLK